MLLKKNHKNRFFQCWPKFCCGASCTFKSQGLQQCNTNHEVMTKVEICTVVRDSLMRLKFSKHFHFCSVVVTIWVKCPKTHYLVTLQNWTKGKIYTQKYRANVAQWLTRVCGTGCCDRSLFPAPIRKDVSWYHQKKKEIQNLC